MFEVDNSNFVGVGIVPFMIGVNLCIVCVLVAKGRV